MPKPEDDSADGPDAGRRPGVVGSRRRWRWIVLGAAAAVCTLVALGVFSAWRASTPASRAGTLLAQLRNARAPQPALGNFIKDLLRRLGLMSDSEDTETDTETDIERELIALGPKAVPRLAEALADSGEIVGVRTSLPWILGEIGGPDALEALVAALKDKNPIVRGEAAKGLGWMCNPKAVPPLLDTLENDDSARARAVAAWSLGRIGDRRAAEPVVAALGDAAKEVRRSAARALGDLGDRRAVEPVAAALGDAVKEVRWWAAHALGALGDPRAVPALVAALKDTEADVRREAVNALGEIGDPRAVPALVESLEKDSEELVRCTAAGALGKIGDPQALPALLTALNGEDRPLRPSAARALGRIGDPRVVDPLAECLKNRSWGVSWLVAEALGEIGDPRAVPALVTALADRGDIGLRMATVRALGRIDDPRVLPVLMESLEKDSEAWARAGAAEALGNLGDPPVLPALIELLEKDSDEQVRAAAARALGNLGDARAVDPLIAALRDKNGKGQFWPVVALGAIGDPRAAPPIVPLLDDKDKDVRAAAAYALGLLGYAEATGRMAEILRKERSYWEWPRFAAAVTLAHLDTPEAREALRQGAAECRDLRVRSFAARALETSCVQALAAELAEKEGDYPHYAAEVLGHIRSSEALAALDAASKGRWSVARFDARDAARRIRRLMAAGATPAGGQ